MKKKQYSYLSKSGYKKAPFRFLRNRKPITAPVNINSVIFCPTALEDTITEIVLRLEKRFTSQIKIKCAKPSFGNEFIELSRNELAHVIHILPNTGPGPDGATSRVLKILFDIFLEDLLNAIK